MRTLIQDLKYAFRTHMKTPGFTLVTVATLAIGIAASTAVFGWIDSVLLRPIPGAKAGPDLVAFETVAPNGEALTTSYADYRDYRDNLKLLSGLTLGQPRAFSLGEEQRSERVWGELVAGNYFSVLGVEPLLGRTFSPEESGDKQGAYPVAVISESLWKRHFGGDPNVLGRTVRVNRQQLTVVGVVPKDFHGTIPGVLFEMWVPAMMGNVLNFMPDWMMADRKTRSFIALGRLRPGVTMEQARAEIQAEAEHLDRQFPATNRGMRATVLPLMRGHFGAQNLLLEPLKLLMAVCVVVVLIVCANVANLLMARSAARRREFSLRMSLGAGRWRLARMILTETLALGLLATAISVPLAAWITQALGMLIPSGTLPVALEAKMSPNVLMFIVGIALATSALSGLMPAWQAVRGDVNESLKEGGRSGTSGSSAGRMRSMLVVSEVALALVALIGAGLFARSFEAARKIQPGFDPNGVLVSHLYLSAAGYDVPARVQFCRDLKARLEAQPGVTGVTYADYVPMGFDAGSWEDLQVAGYVPAPAENMKIYRNVVSPGYFDLLKIPLIEGRDFNDLDDKDHMPAMIVNETFTQRFLGGRNPVGVKVQGWGKWFTIVGKAKDTKVHTPNEPATPFFYVPFRQVYRADLQIAFYVRSRMDVGQTLQLVRARVAEIDPNVGVFDAMPMTEYISASLFGQKVAASLLSALGAVALLLSGIGLYSVISYSIAQRRQEIGIRMALGAKPGDVLSLVLRHGMGLTAVGLAAGAAAAAGATRLASGMLIGVSATDPAVFLGAAAFLAGVALLATCAPAVRAARIDPNIALRGE